MATLHFHGDGRECDSKGRSLLYRDHLTGQQDGDESGCSGGCSPHLGEDTQERAKNLPLKFCPLLPALV